MDFTWRTEDDSPPPVRLTPVDDRLTADDAVRRTRRGEHLLYEGDFNNAKQLLSAMSRRLPAPKASTWQASRAARQLEADTVGRVVVALDRRYALALKRAPDVAPACTHAWGPAPGDRTVVALKTLLGMLGVAELRKKGLRVPGLKGVLDPHWGVYAPTRSEYLALLDQLDVKGKSVIDLGTGTGVIGFMLLQRGAVKVTATDLDARAIACATENAKRLELEDRFTAQLTEGWPDVTADLAICNPGWLPTPPKTRIDRAVFDDGNRFLLGFLDGLKAHAREGALLISNLAELLKLREPGWLEAQLSARGLNITAKHHNKPKHGRAYDKKDVLHAARSQEITTLYVVN